MPVAMPIQTDWVKSVLFDRGYLSRIRGEAIKVYLVMLEGCGGTPDQSVTISLSQLTRRTRLSCPTVIESLSRLEDLGLVVSTTHERGKVKTYYVSDPPASRLAVGRDERRRGMPAGWRPTAPARRPPTASPRIADRRPGVASRPQGG